jgi:transposase-like protein
MLIHLHKQATTTPKVRAAIQASTEPASALAERFGTTEQTVYKWKHRDSVHDRSHTPHRLQTTLTPAQEAVAVVLRKTLLVSLDDLLAVVREFMNPDVSRSGLDRCLRRHGVGNLRDLQANDPRPKHKAFKAYEPGYMHVDVKYLPQMADVSSRRYLFVGAVAIGCSQHDTGAPDDLPGGVAVGDPRFQLRTVGGAKIKADVVTPHASTLTHPTGNGNHPSGDEH